MNYTLTQKETRFVWFSLSVLISYYIYVGFMFLIMKGVIQ